MDPVVRALGSPTTCTTQCRTIYLFQDQVPGEVVEDYSCYFAGNKEWRRHAAMYRPGATLDRSCRLRRHRRVSGSRYAQGLIRLDIQSGDGIPWWGEVVATVNGEGH